MRETFSRSVREVEWTRGGVAANVDQQLRELVGQRARCAAAACSPRTQPGEQARRTGISASALSQLENNRGDVSLDRLQRFAEDFRLHVTDLLEPPAQPVADGAAPDAEVVHNCLSQLPGVRRGRGVVYQLVGPGAGHRLQPYLLAFEPGRSFEDDKIGQVGEEFACALQGEVELLLDEHVYRLSQGDKFVINDKSSFHGYSLDGPHGFAKDFTKIPFVGRKTFLLNLKAGKHKYYCPNHESTMFAHFTVK
jgi:hypothetical protein